MPQKVRVCEAGERVWLQENQGRRLLQQPLVFHWGSVDVQCREVPWDLSSSTPAGHSCIQPARGNLATLV